MTNLMETHPLISQDWDYEKNKGASPVDFIASDRKSAWWTCNNNHSYQVSIYSRVRSNGCKICSRTETENKKNIKRLNKKGSFAEKHPNLTEEWDYEKNSTMSPNMVTYRSKKKVWWTCVKNHSWLATPYSRSVGYGCPKCSRKIGSEKLKQTLLAKNGSLAEKFPSLLKEWDFERNKIKPSDISPFSNKLAFWVCKLNHKWSAKIYNRTGNGSNCPECKPQSSRIEMYILCELQSLFQNIKWRKKFNGVECDIYIPEINIGIEVDGGYWHADKLAKDNEKDKFFENLNIDLIRVREDSLPKTSAKNIQFKNGENLQIITNRLVNYLLPFDSIFKEYKFDQTAKNQFNKMVSRLPAPPKGDTLEDTHPEIAAEWDYSNNHPLTPDLFSHGSKEVFFWTCPEKHSYKASIKNRAQKNSGCPECYKINRADIAMKASLSRTFSLESENPHYLNMFDAKKNDLNPSEIPLRSKRSFWWRCAKQHSFQKTAASMRLNQDCPECSLLIYSHPKLALEIHPIKNEGININSLRKGYSKKIWWKCKKGHEWERDISSRVRENSGCPQCFNEKRSEIIRKSSALKAGSLSEKMPAILEQWDYDKNQVFPSEVALKSNKKVWWRCLNGHPAYEQSILLKVNGQGCPKCANVTRVEKMRVSRLKKLGSFKDNHPELMKYWDEAKNQLLNPAELTSGSKEKAYWVCLNNHEWESSLNTMTAKRRLHICPICKNSKE